MTIAIIVIVIIIVLVAAVVAAVLLRRRALRRRFGPEYDRLAQEVGERRAVSELSERQRRIEQLDIRPLSAERRAAYDTQWASLQVEFVDAPPRAAEAAGELVTAVAADRGYQVAEKEQLLTDLSVYHADRLEEYRRARQTTEQAGAATEDLRQAMLGYRALLRELLDAPDGASQREQATEPTPPVPPTPPLTPPAPPAPRASEPDDAEAPRTGTGTGTWADIAAGTGAQTGGGDLDDSDDSEGSPDDRSAAQATRKD